MNENDLHELMKEYMEKSLELLQEIANNTR